MAQSTEPVVRPINPLGEGADFSIEQFLHQTSIWFQTHYLELLFAIIIGAGFFFILGAIKRYAARRVRNNEGLIGYRAILLKAIARTSKFFMLMVSAELVVTVSSAPQLVERVVHIAFTISAVIQAAIWLREIILGIV